MADESTSSSSPNTSNNGWNNPQVIIALITGLVSVLVTVIGVLPNLINANEATATPTAMAVVLIVATPTDVPLLPTSETQTLPTAVPTTESSTAPTTAPTIQPTAESTTAPVATNSPSPNVLLIYDNVSFSLVNTSGRRLSLDNVTFQSGSRIWESLAWANHRRIPNGNCMRIRDASVSNRNPPGECSELLSLILIGGSAMFWTEADTFDVLQGSQVIATCTTDTDRCAIYIPQD